MKPSGDIDEIGFVTWSAKQKSNAWIWLRGLKKGEWAEATADFGTLKGAIDEVQFALPKGAELLVDDVLFYEP